MSELFFKIRGLYLKHGGPNAAAITSLTWPYGKHVGKEFHYEPRKVAAEINGFFLEDKTIENPTKKGEFKTFKKGDLVPTFAWLQDDGSTSSGCWVYCGSVDKEKGILSMRRGQADPTGLGLYPEWCWTWPVNRRIIYNGASVDTNGKPWDPSRAVITWDAKEQKWKGDVPDGAGNPGKGRPPFIMNRTAWQASLVPVWLMVLSPSITNLWNARWREICFRRRKIIRLSNDSIRRASAPIWMHIPVSEPAIPASRLFVRPTGSANIGRRVF